MTAVPVTLYATRPPETAPATINTVTMVDDLDTVMDSVKCSCAAGDDNPH
ncbi:hypothetical protein QZH56_19940 [Streptomyces olivoreticuli]|nr:hypothetical protein [Streptomyces olivoreticuli]WKK21141.1 hypothetical protein QZH56_19940 [Streptomyces olivoreticuli]